ncbi:MAG: hypothetical protein U0271_12165 [Polyangiaceae bacterium]
MIGRSTAPLALVLLSALANASCSGTQQAEPTSKPTAVAKPTTPPPPDNKAKLAKVPETYKSFDFKLCTPGTNCARTMAGRAGLDLGESGKNPLPNPRAELDNPDPVWIPEWLRLPTTDAGSHYAFEAMALAAVNKTWRASCEEAYKAYDKSLTERLSTLEKSIQEKNALTNPYDRLAGLLAIEPDKPNKSKMGEFLKGSDPVRFRWEAALFDAFEDTARTFVYMVDSYSPSDELLAVIHPRQAKEYELEAFCVEASKGNIEGVSALPDTSSWDAEVRAMVKPPIADASIKYVEQRRKEMVDVTRAKWAKVKVPNPQLPTGVREMNVNNVKSFKRDGKGAIVVSIVSSEKQVPGTNGRMKTQKIDDVATATFTDWPSNLELTTGDSVSFYGAEISVKEVIIQSSGDLEHRSREYKIEGKHVTKATAGGKATVYFR